MQLFVYYVVIFYIILVYCFFFFFSSRRRHTRWTGDWSSDVCSSDLASTCSGIVLTASVMMKRGLGAGDSGRKADRAGRSASRESGRGVATGRRRAQA